MINLSNSPLKLGLTIDLYNYSNKNSRGEYIKWFADDTSGEGPKVLHVYTIDKHVHEKDGIFTLEDRKRLEDRVGEFSVFIKENFPQIDLVSFQYPYNQLPPEILVLSDLDKLYGSKKDNSTRNKLISQGKILNLDDAKEMILSYLDILSNSDFSSLKYQPTLVLHAGGILPSVLADRQKIRHFNLIRERLQKYQVEYHTSLIKYVSDKNVVISLENIPIFDNGDSYSDQWLSEHCFEDFAERFKHGGIHTIDLAHLVMDVAYFNQDKLKVFSLDMIKEEFGTVPPSLTSVQNYVKIASNFLKDNLENKYPRIIYHLNDCNGFLGDNEGLQIGVENSLMPWKNIIKTMMTYTPDAYAALEIQNGHLKENYDRCIRQSLKKFLNYCEEIGPN